MTTALAKFVEDAIGNPESQVKTEKYMFERMNGWFDIRIQLYKLVKTKN